MTEHFNGFNFFKHKVAHSEYLLSKKWSHENTSCQGKGYSSTNTDTGKNSTNTAPEACVTGHFAGFNLFKYKVTHHQHLLSERIMGLSKTPICS